MANIPPIFTALHIFHKNLFSSYFLESSSGTIKSKKGLKLTSAEVSQIQAFFSYAMTSYKKIEVLLEDHNSQKWRLPLKEDVFITFQENGNPAAHKIFGEGSLFSPLLFGKFFDPSDAFPLWEFDADILLSNLCSPSDKRTVDWFQTELEYVLKAELPEVGKNSIQVCVEKAKVVEISGRWRQQKESRTEDWRGCHWWEHGYVRRIELPEDADWRSMEACVNSDKYLEIKIPKSPVNCVAP